MPAKDTDLGGVQHELRTGGPTGRRRYPFKVMQVGDWILLTSAREAQAIRDAIRSHVRRLPDRKFSVRQRLESDEVWICRRIA